MKTVNVASVSGGKDSTALWLLALERGVNIMPIFCDTGHEHQLTYEYLEYLQKQLGSIKTVKADFKDRISRKRLYVVNHWPRKLTLDVEGHWFCDDEGNENPAPAWEPGDKYKAGVSENGWEWVPPVKGMTDSQAAEVVERALSVLYPTENPFLDLCLWKGRFPSTKARFCTQFLKVFPSFEQVYEPLLSGGAEVVSWQGVRADESLARAKLPEQEDTPEGYRIYRPLLHWNVDDVFAMHRKHGIDPNPLYKLGMGRVGCMPCINCNKAELFEIARRFPNEIARVAEWEQIVKMASKRGAATFFPTAHGQGNGIHEWVEWSKTSYGGKNYDLMKKLAWDSVPMCSSQYGLCE